MDVSPHSLGHCFPAALSATALPDVAVVTPTVLRPSLLRAVRSVFEQTNVGHVQLLIGVDVAKGPIDPVLELFQRRPAHVSAIILQLPYSTSVRHGGLYTAMDGGALRSILSLMANARHVAYLDDDNTWSPSHLSALKSEITGKAWAYSLRTLVDEETDEELGIDKWDSCGIDQGRFAAQGGFVDPNCLLIDKLACGSALGRWTDSGTGLPGLTADRHFFSAIRQAPHACTGKATVEYRIRRTNVLWKFIRSEKSG